MEQKRDSDGRRRQLSVPRRKRAAAARRVEGVENARRGAKAADAVRAPRVGLLTFHAAEKWRKVGVSEPPRQSFDWLPDPRRGSARGERAQRGRGRRARRKGARTRCAGEASLPDPGKSVCALCPSVSRRLNRQGFVQASALHALSFSPFQHFCIARVRRSTLQPPPPRSSRYNDQTSFTGPARLNPV
jgi:hypothetical protein